MDQWQFFWVTLGINAVATLILALLVPRVVPVIERFLGKFSSGIQNRNRKAASRSYRRRKTLKYDPVALQIYTTRVLIGIILMGIFAAALLLLFFVATFSFPEQVSGAKVLTTKGIGLLLLATAGMFALASILSGYSAFRRVYRDLMSFSEYEDKLVERFGSDILEPLPPEMPLPVYGGEIPTPVPTKPK